MKAHEPTKLGNTIAIFAGLDLLLFAGLLFVTLWTGESGARLFSLLLILCLLFDGVLWILSFLHVVRIFLSPQASEADVFVGIAEAILVFALTPVLFRMGTALLLHPENILFSFQDTGLIRIWGLSRLTNVYVLFVRFLGLRWMDSGETKPLTMADVSLGGTDLTSNEEEE